MGEAEEERMPSWGLEPGRELGRGWVAGSDGKLCLRWGGVSPFAALISHLRTSILSNKSPSAFCFVFTEKLQIYILKLNIPIKHGN